MLLSAEERRNMSRQIKVVLTIVVLATISAISGNAAEQGQTLPKPPDKQTLRADQVKQLMLLMDTDKDGKISKEEWLAVMAAEFDRLDKDKNAKLDVKEIAPYALRARHFADMGK
jgi:hypothetical protein